jgi:hypothetical protein
MFSEVESSNLKKQSKLKQYADGLWIEVKAEESIGWSQSLDRLDILMKILILIWGIFYYAKDDDENGWM